MDSPADRDRVFERYVAGLDVSEDELARASVGRALDTTVVVAALLRGLNDESAGVRTRAAERAAEMHDLAPALHERLETLALTDRSRRARAGAAAALRAHGLPVPGDRAEQPPTAGIVERIAMLLGPATCRPARVVRGPAQRYDLTFEARDRSEAPDLRGQLIGLRDSARIDLAGLPEGFVTHRVVLLMRADPAAESMPVAESVEPVGADRAVSIPVPLAGRDPKEILALLERDLELIAIDDPAAT